MFAVLLHLKMSVTLSFSEQKVSSYA